MTRDRRLAMLALTALVTLAVTACSVRGPDLERCVVRPSAAQSPSSGMPDPSECSPAAAQALADPANRGASITLVRAKGGKWQVSAIVTAAESRSVTGSADVATSCPQSPGP